MKLLRQTQLLQGSGSAEKVYELDLCEVGTNAYVVNFRYGKRGRALQDGSMTPLPVPLREAEQIFDSTVQQRLAKGYFDPKNPGAAQSARSNAGPTSGPTRAPTGRQAKTQKAARKPSESERNRAVVDRLNRGEVASASWTLDRAIWRAGELGLPDAEPALLRHMTARGAENLRRYACAWALTTCGSRASVPALVSLYEDSATPETTRRIVAEALSRLLSPAERAGLFARELGKLPPALRALAENGTASAFTQALQSLLDSSRPAGLAAIAIAHFVDSAHTREAVLEFCRHAPVSQDYFQQLRSLYKLSELRKDAQLLGVLAHRFETSPAQQYGHEPKRLHPLRPFRAATRDYYRRRTWRTLRRQAELDLTADAPREGFVRLAVGVLAPFTDANVGSGVPDYLPFSHLIPKRGASDPYAVLWDRAPHALVHLIDESECESVHHFAVTALRRNTTFLQAADTELTLMLLGRPYAVTAMLGLELARRLYDPSAPNKALVLGLVNAAAHEARAQGRAWVDQKRGLYLEDSAFLCALVTSRHADSRAFAKALLKAATLSESVGQALVGRLVAALQPLGEESVALAVDVAEVLQRSLAAHVSAIGIDVLRDLARHSLASIQELAGDLLLANPALAENVPNDILMALLSGKSAGVRATAVRLLGQRSDQDLAERTELLFHLATHPQADVRNAMRGLAQRAAQVSATCQKTLGDMLSERLRFKAEGDLHVFLLDLLQHELAMYPGTLDTKDILRLLNSRFTEAQIYGCGLLANQVHAADLTIADLVSLLSHDMRAVRECAWLMIEESIPRLVHSMDKAVTLVDAKWEDSRNFAFELFADKLPPGALTPDVLVSICDSVRPEVQQFGRSLITRRFQEQDGQAYLLRLSEHPSEAMQLFATNYIERFAAGNLARLSQLIPYFITVLSRVNRGALARERVLAFLEAQALESEEAAALLGEVLARHSVTMAVLSKTSTIEAMVRIQQKYPAVALPTRPITIPVRGDSHGV